MQSRACARCGRYFRPRTVRRLFCSDRCRVAHYRENSLECFYCGELAYGKDHVTPHSIVGLPDRVVRLKNTETVPCCGECNKLLPDSGSFEERLLGLGEKIEKKYQLQKNMPHWDASEVKQLGYSLRSSVQGKLEERDRAKRRLHYIAARLAQFYENGGG